MQNVGRRIRELRQRRGWTLEGLSERCGLSMSFLSQVERGLSSLSISSLQAICRALEVPLTHFFAPPEGNSQVLRAGQARTRLRIEDSQVTYHLLSGAMPDRMLEALIAEFPPHYEHPLITHGGEEFGYVVEGKIVLQFEDHEFELGPGDNFHFFSTQPHTIRNPRDVTAKVLWVLTQKLLEGGMATDGETSGHRHRRDVH
ncbi:MAG: helix-turn-helix domain-containing protein [Candidatus Bipolaricaulaceae bacterium]